MFSSCSRAENLRPMPHIINRERGQHFVNILRPVHQARTMQRRIVPHCKGLEAILAKRLVVRDADADRNACTEHLRDMR